MEAAELDWAIAPEDIINGAKSPSMILKSWVRIIFLFKQT
jgi:hypothetical protein